MDSLPLEILDIIARVGTYHGLLCLRKFTDSLNISQRVDFMTELGFSIEINRTRTIWKYNDLPHRIDGLAIEHSDGSKEWYSNGEQHRIDEPAIESVDGTMEWWINGVQQNNN